MTRQPRHHLFDVSAATLASAPTSITAADIEDAAAGFVPHRQVPTDPPPSLSELFPNVDDAAYFQHWQMTCPDLIAAAFMPQPPLLVAPAIPTPGFICEVCFDAMATITVPASDLVDAYGACAACASASGRA